MPLSTLCLAEDNYSLYEYENKANKVSNGNCDHNFSIYTIFGVAITIKISLVKLFL